jgi:mono/diheme cytochrome c family protein
MKGTTMDRVAMGGAWWLPVSLLLLAGAVCGSAVGQAAPAETPGKYLYLKYCGACHGVSGKGDGVASGYLRPKPTDLTQLAKAAGGEFPYVATMQSIDGTKSVRAHGDPEMPVWGAVFRQDSSVPMERRIDVQGKLMLITDYIRSIQTK